VTKDVIVGGTTGAGGTIKRVGVDVGLGTVTVLGPGAFEGLGYGCLLDPEPDAAGAVEENKFGFSGAAVLVGETTCVLEILPPFIDACRCRASVIDPDL
jgi:hypothetical protein